MRIEYVCVYMCMYVYVHVYVRACVYVCMHIYRYVRMHVCIQKYAGKDVSMNIVSKYLQNSNSVGSWYVMPGTQTTLQAPPTNDTLFSPNYNTKSK